MQRHYVVLAGTRETTQPGETLVERVESVQLHSVVLVGTRETMLFQAVADDSDTHLAVLAVLAGIRETSQPGKTPIELVESVQLHSVVPVGIREMMLFQAVAAE